ncbi:MarR family transcriptional regulator [Nocardia caishijiensis]|uniref:MarR family transcriptional regulator n=1 Tax=Nocardia caishijiensis TaxID=184756 RepID=A0ABQ6YMV8_9NOCA|nr:MarR family transcriptional regulator [Nocardia caishijiensis]KAF0847132.1 MarR family transcriptional regulator [Nocardia caishijiensis]
MHKHELAERGDLPVGDPVDEWFRASALVATVDSGLGKWLTLHHGIGLTEYHALRQLAAAPDKEIRVSELAGRIGLNQSSVTRLLGRLEGRGFTRRDLCSEDGRGVYAVITPAGEVLVREAREPFRLQLERLLADAAELSPIVDALVARRSETDHLNS